MSAISSRDKCSMSIDVVWSMSIDVEGLISIDGRLALSIEWLKRVLSDLFHRVFAC
ncbi:hypothetical protein F2Q70_00030901 [Brassica cretica]|uniref:Uncharacterized protein n=1 Tax=Brassica cretica TaxID=69181 RepID=A0A8S9FCA0_BRACR|nr:hypothetical protein F2Q70_00030901 [Brassica cretica]